MCSTANLSEVRWFFRFAVITCCDASELLDLSEEALNQATVYVEILAEGETFPPVLPGRDVGPGNAFGRQTANAAAVISLATGRTIRCHRGPLMDPHAVRVVDDITALGLRDLL